jgi:hypothetical protein
MNLNKPSCLFLRKTNRGLAMFSALLSFKKKDDAVGDVGTACGGVAQTFFKPTYG